ncbi:MAG: hypothetical protein KBG77_10955, partial [Dermatophilaceae bacterium]|nr:hypothetical protein [Dermatophilaceae bacterium]
HAELEAAGEPCARRHLGTDGIRARGMPFTASTIHARSRSRIAPAAGIATAAGIALVCASLWSAHRSSPRIALVRASL